MLEESKEFRFSLDELARRITPRTRMIVINTPQNPTGGVLTLEDLKGIANLARKHDLLILSDEIYSEIYYDAPSASMLDVPDIMDRLILVSGFSKTYAMTGWRIGYSRVPNGSGPDRQSVHEQQCVEHVDVLPAGRGRGLHRGIRTDRRKRWCRNSASDATYSSMD